jgi:tetratricopeptide (TPR) repeat protein
VARLGIQAAEALDHAHQQGIVHRDVKPANLLVDADGRLWVTDFGLAQFQTDAGVTMTGDLVGTIRYMSPEQALAKRVVVDHRTDIYSLGVTLYELLTLEPAFRGGDRQELLRQIAFEEPRRPRLCNKAIPRELETILLKAIEKNPADRYGTAQEMADDLERFVKDEPIRARRPSLARRVKAWGRRHKPMLWSATAALIVVLVTLAGTIGWVMRDREIRRSETERRVEVAMQEEEALRKERKYPEALSAARHAAALLTGGEGGEELRQRVQARLADQELIARLEDIRSSNWSWNNEPYDPNASDDREYTQAFRAYGVDVDNLSAEQIAILLKGRVNCVELAAYIDRWARACKKSEPQGRRWQHLLAIAESADADSFRNQLREAYRREDRKSVEQLVSSATGAEVPLPTASLMAPLLRNAGTVAQALSVLRTAQQRDPGDFWLNFELGRYYGEIKPRQLDEQVRFYSAALAIRPASTHTLINLGDALTGKRAFKEAEAAFRRAIELKPHAVSYGGLGNTLREQRKLLEAAAAFRKAIELMPPHFVQSRAQAYGFLGLVLADQKKGPEAIAAIRKAIELKPDRIGEYYDSLGSVLLKQGDLDEAILSYRKAVSIDKDHAISHNSLGWVLALQKKWPEAAAEFQEAIKIDKDDAWAHFNYGNALRFQKKYSQAIDEWREALRINKDYGDAHRNLAANLVNLGRHAEAVPHAERASELTEYRKGTLAFVALVAGSGQGKDTATLIMEQQARFRKKALPLFHAEVDAMEAAVNKDPDNAGNIVGLTMFRWQHHSIFNRVRGGAALAKLPEDERQEWQKLWDRVETLRKRLLPPGYERNFVRTWLVLSESLPAGPDGVKALGQQQISGEGLLRPRAGDRVEVNGKALAWKEHRCAGLHIDFKDLYSSPSDYRVAYAVCYVHADKDRSDLVLRVGSDDQAKVYLNGKEIYQSKEIRVLDLDDDEVPIELRTGSNVLVFKVVNEEVEWGGSLHIVGKDGGEAKGIEYRLEP